MNFQEHVVIIGNGVAGITAARHIRRISNKRITVISAENDFFFSRTALMYVYMGHLKWENLEPFEKRYWKENRIELKNAWVEKIETSSKSLFLKGKEVLNYDKLILATGSVPRKLGWPGENLPGIQGLVTKQDLELLEKNTTNCRQAVIVGGGLIGIELAEMLHTRKIPVTMLIRENSFWRNVLPQQDADFVSRHISSHGIDLKFNTEIERFSGGNKVEAVHTTKGDEILCDLMGLTVGVQPNIKFLEGSEIETERGILVNELLETNVKDVYAIGDCAQHKNPAPGREKIEAVWYTARMMGETVAQTICGRPFNYNPGHWFNSAKFFEIEYQTYGRVAANPSEGEQHLHWVNKDHRKAITISFDRNSSLFLGINTFGIRMRHEVFDRWLSEKQSIEHIIQNLKEANFDPEFYDRHEQEIFSSFKESFKTKAEV